MNRLLSTLAGAALVSGALCLTNVGTAQAISGNFACGFASLNPNNQTVSTTLCTGGPANATSGTITSNFDHARFSCARLTAEPFGSFFFMVFGQQCRQL